MYSPASLESRNYLLQEIVADFARDPEVVGVFLAGSLAADTADVHSDIDLRVVVAPTAISRFCQERISRPERWSGFLFNEWADDETCCVSHFEDFTKVDIFYACADAMEPSPWFSLPTRILHDPTGLIGVTVAKSAFAEGTTTPLVVERTIGKTIAYAIEVARRMARGELAYAQSLLDGLRNRIVTLEDLLEDRSPGLNSSFKIEKRISPQLLQEIYAACPHTEPEELNAALTRMINVCRKLVCGLHERSKLSRSPTTFLRALDALGNDDA
jgi:predicted nucleotidyltransferase